MISKERIEEIRARAKSEFDSSRQFYTSVQSQQERALAYYNQVPYAGELAPVAGHSAYITSDVRDTVDFYLGQMMDMFGRPGFVKFDAHAHEDPKKAQEDIKQADVETSYCDHVLFEENDGFMHIHNWIKDALIQKNGVIKVYWDEAIDEKTETYDKVNYLEYGELLNDKEFEVKTVKISMKGLEGELTPEEFGQELDRLGITDPNIIQFTEFKVKGVRVKDYRQVRFRNVAPENLVISSQWTSPVLDDCPYIGERMYKTRAELIGDGYDFDTVMNLPRSSIHSDVPGVAIRYDIDQSKLVEFDNVTEAGELVEVIEHYFIDFDRKEPKMYCLITAGDGETILDCYEEESHGYISTTPKLEPYNYYGSSVADEVVDIQFSRSNIRRAALDNLTLTAIPRTKSRGDVDLEALFDVRAGVNVHLNSPDADVVPIEIPFVAQDALNFEQFLSNDRAERTGFSRETAGLDPAALANSTNFIGGQILNQSMLKVKLAASCMAYVGFKQLFKKIRELLYKHEDRQQIFDMFGKQMSVNPRKWRSERGCSVRVGLGYAGKQERVTALQENMKIQEKLLQAGGLYGNPLVNVQNVYELLKELNEAAGLRDFASFFSDPADFKPQPPKPQPAELQAQGYLQDVENRKQVEMAKIQAENARKEKELNEEYRFKREQLYEEIKFKYDKLISEKQADLAEQQNKRQERIAEASKAVSG